MVPLWDLPTGLDAGCRSFFLAPKAGFKDGVIEGGIAVVTRRS